MARKQEPAPALNLVLDVKHALLDLLIDALGRVDKRLFDIGRRLGRRFDEKKPVLARKLLALLARHGPL